MTTVERYRPPHIFSSDAPTNTRRSRPTSRSITNIPPAVPSPPQLSRDSPPQQPQIRGDDPSKFNMAPNDLDQWIFTDDELMSSPSILSGVDPKLERQQRAKGTNFILQAAILLKIPQITIGVASTFLHRFYMRLSMDPKRGFHHYTVAATALFLASKTEETCRKTKEIVIACTKVAQKNPNLVVDEQSTEYWRWRDNIMHHEEVLLEFLTFDLVLESPYNSLYKCLRDLGIEGHAKLRNLAWAFLNDGSHTTICLSLTPKDIAISAIYFATQFSQDTIPDDEDGTAWWERLGGTANNIVKGCSILSRFWRENPLARVENPYERSPIYTADDLNRSRRSADITTPSPMHTQMSRNNSHMSNGPANGAGENLQNLKANGKMERSASSNGVGKTEDGESKAASASKDEERTKAVEKSSGTSDRALKEAANDPATHAPETVKQGVKRKDNIDSGGSPAKRTKTLNENSPEEDAKVDAPSTKLPTAHSNRRETTAEKAFNGTLKDKQKSSMADAKLEAGGEEIEEGELEEYTQRP